MVGQVRKTSLDKSQFTSTALYTSGLPFVADISQFVTFKLIFAIIRFFKIDLSDLKEIAEVKNVNLRSEIVKSNTILKKLIDSTVGKQYKVHKNSF